MNARLFSEAISNVDDRYYEEAANYERRQKKLGWITWSAMAACFVGMLAAAFSYLPNHLNQRGATPPDNPIGVVSDHPNEDTPSTAPEIRISMDHIFLNEMAELLDAAPRWYDPELFDTVVWDQETVIRYYGKDLTPAYIPDGLIAAPGNGTAAVILDKEGSIIMDTVWLGFYHGYYEDGSPRLTEDVAACKGFSITASKTGLLKDCLYLLPENEMKTSDIGGTPVTFGYRSMPYGPYDPETHEPSGCYELYVAELKHDSTEYQIVAEQMDVEELVKVVTAIITGREDIVIDAVAHTEHYMDHTGRPNPG